MAIENSVSSDFYLRSSIVMIDVFKCRLPGVLSSFQCLSEYSTVSIQPFPHQFNPVYTGNP